MEHEQQLFASNVAKLIEYIFKCGYTCTLGEAYRTPEQAAIDARKCIGIKNSLHTHRLAIDINLFDTTGQYQSETSSYEKFGIFWESLHDGNRWGGRFKHRADGNHFECHTIHVEEQSSYIQHINYGKITFIGLIALFLMYLILRSFK